MNIQCVFFVLIAWDSVRRGIRTRNVYFCSKSERSQHGIHGYCTAYILHSKTWARLPAEELRPDQTGRLKSTICKSMYRKYASYHEHQAWDHKRRYCTMYILRFKRVWPPKGTQCILDSFYNFTLDTTRSLHIMHICHCLSFVRNNRLYVQKVLIHNHGTHNVYSCMTPKTCIKARGRNWALNTIWSFSLREFGDVLLTLCLNFNR